MGTMMTVAMVAAVMAGCSSDKNASTPAIEPNVMPTNYRKAMLEFLQGQLIDPVGVRDAYITEPKLQAIGTENRYIVCVRYNTKDSYGQYIGIRDNVAIYFNGRLNQYLPARGDICLNAAYQRFPELETLKRPSS